MTAKVRKTISQNPLDQVEIIDRSGNDGSVGLKGLERKSAKSGESNSSFKSKKIVSDFVVPSETYPSFADSPDNDSSGKHDFPDIRENEAETSVRTTRNSKRVGKHQNNSKFIARKKLNVPINGDALSVVEIFENESKYSNMGSSIVCAPDKSLITSRAQKTVMKWSWISVPAALMPLAVVDSAASLAIQVMMIRELCKVYGIPFKTENARAFISGLVGGGVAMVVSSGLNKILLKSLPHAGPVISFLAQPASGFSTTYALGRVFISHVENNGQLTNFNPNNMAAAFKGHLETGKKIFKSGNRFLSKR